MANAIHPDYFKDFRDIVKEKEEEPIEIREEQVLSEMSNMAGWKVLREYITDLVGSLDAPAHTAMESGCSYDEIGRKTIIAQLTKEFLLKVIEKVENARIALETKTD